MKVSHVSCKNKRRTESVISTVKIKRGKSHCSDKKTINQYVIEQELGKGSFATVYLCHVKDTGVKYALKEMDKALLKKKRVGKKKNAYDCILEELKVLQRLEHPNIIWLHEVINDPKRDKMFLVTEWMKNGSIASMVGK